MTEILITLPIAITAIGIILTIFWTVTNLINRNLATNVGHLYMLTPVQRLSLDIHTSVNTPELTSTPTISGTNFSAPIVSGTGPAPGLKVDCYVAGPFAVFNNSNPNSKDIQIDLNGATVDIRPGMYIHIPSYVDSNKVPINRPITSVSKGTNPQLKLDSALGVAITAQAGTGGGSNGTVQVPAYITMPVNYYVSGKTLIRREGTGASSTLIKNFNTTKPFTKPDPSNTRFVGLTLNTSNSDYSARNYRASSLMIEDLWVPARGQLVP